MGADAYVEHVRDLLDGLGPIRIKRMFGGAGVYCDDLMFALIAGEDLYIKGDDANRAAFEAAGSDRFTAEMKGRLATMNYWRLPPEAAEDPTEALRWAKLGLEVARRAKRPRSRATAPAHDLGPGPWDE